jgi:hypothetical protein
MKTRFLMLEIFALLVTGSLLTSCEDCITGNGKMITKYIKIGDITQIKLSGEANLILVADSTDSLKIEGESNVIDVFEFDQSGKSLKIRSEGCILHHETVTITVPVRLLESLTLNGSGNISSSSTLHGMDLEIDLNGSGDINLGVDAENVESKINGSGNINLKGSAKNQHIQINGSGNVEASDFASGDVRVTINGSGDCKVMATSALKVVIRGSGNVYYKGSPDVSTEVKGSGTVGKLN